MTQPNPNKIGLENAFDWPYGDSTPKRQTEQPFRRRDKDPKFSRALREKLGSEISATEAGPIYVSDKTDAPVEIVKISGAQPAGVTEISGTIPAREAVHEHRQAS